MPLIPHSQKWDVGAPHTPLSEVGCGCAPHPTLRSGVYILRAQVYSMGAFFFVWSYRRAQHQLKCWTNPRPGRDSPRLKDYLVRLNVNCFKVEVNEKTLKNLRNLMLKYPEDIIILRMDQAPLTDTDLLDEMDKLYESNESDPGRPPSPQPPSTSP